MRRFRRIISSSDEEENNASNIHNQVARLSSLVTDLSARMDNLASTSGTNTPTAEVPALTETTLSLGRDDMIPPFNPTTSKITIERWLAAVEELRGVFGWSERLTIYYAMRKLEGTAHHWYRFQPNFALTWQQWKEKLQHAFATTKRFRHLMEKLVARRKRNDETYEKYFIDVKGILNSAKITGQAAIDTIIDGINDPNVRTTAISKIKYFIMIKKCWNI